jgi:hypothetical protein
MRFFLDVQVRNECGQCCCSMRYQAAIRRACRLHRASGMPPLCFFTFAWCLTGQCRETKGVGIYNTIETHLLSYIRINDMCTLMVLVHTSHYTLMPDLTRQLVRKCIDGSHSSVVALLMCDPFITRP